VPQRRCNTKGHQCGTLESEHWRRPRPTLGASLSSGVEFSKRSTLPLVSICHPFPIRTEQYGYIYPTWLWCLIHFSPPQVYLERRSTPDPLLGMQPSVGLLSILGLSLCLNVNAGPHVKRDDVSLQNGKDAIAFKYALHTHTALYILRIDGR